MTTFVEFYERLADRLGVDASYLTSDIPSSVDRYIARLLRDYNFPKSIRKQLWEDIAAGTQSYTLPTDFKRELLLMFYDDTDAADVAYGEPMRKRETFVRTPSDGVPWEYWIEGTTLWTDVEVDEGSPNTNLALVYQSNGVEYNKAWMLADYEDVLFSLSMFRLSSELGKPELANVWATLWMEDQRSIAIFLNELEYNNLNMLMREGSQEFRERYPTGS